MAITKFEVDYKPVIRKIIIFSGVVKVEGSYAARVVNLYKERTGELAGSAFSNPTTGAWSIDVSDTINVKYFAVCIPTLSSRNAQVFAGLTGV
jgi:hypothetical protein